jgi:hypothetical protein
VLDPEIVALLREAYGDGPYGGWYRVRDMGTGLIVWKNRNHSTVIVLEPAAGFSRIATLRILMHIGGDLRTVAECLTVGGQAPVHLLRGYQLIDARHTSSYRFGQLAERNGVPRGN